VLVKDIYFLKNTFKHLSVHLLTLLYLQLGIRIMTELIFSSKTDGRALLKGTSMVAYKTAENITHTHTHTHTLSQPV